jgi:hypothetical protein
MVEAMQQELKPWVFDPQNPHPMFVSSDASNRLARERLSLPGMAVKCFVVNF